jgi:hypothetical protein
LHSQRIVAEKPFGPERRSFTGTDRRRNSRSGRRTSDPRVNWRRLAWLFAFYAAYLSVRALPLTLRRLLRRAEA